MYTILWYKKTNQKPKNIHPLENIKAKVKRKKKTQDHIIKLGVLKNKV